MMNQGKVLSIVALAIAFSGSAFGKAFNLGAIDLNQVSRSEWINAEPRASVSIDSKGEMREGLSNKLRELVADDAKDKDKDKVELSLDLDGLQAYHEAAKKFGAAIKEGKGKDETDEAYKKRLEGLSAEVGKAAQPIVKSIVKQLGNFGADIIYTRGTDDKIILIFVKVEKDDEGNVKPKILGSLGIQLEIKDGKVVGFGPLAPPKKKD